MDMWAHNDSRTWIKYLNKTNLSLIPTQPNRNLSSSLALILMKKIPKPANQWPKILYKR